MNIFKHSYLKQKIQSNSLIAILGVLILVDLGGVNRRYVNEDNFTAAIKVKKPYSATAIDKAILKDPSVFRVYDTADGTTKASYFHNSIDGYHGAKMRRYNELKEFHIDRGNPEVFNMLNTKYIIYTDEQNQLQRIENEQANGNAWFIKSLETVKDANSEITALGNINTKTTAIINEKLRANASYTLDSLATIQLKNYAPNALEYESNNSNDGFAVFSENYYKEGWVATIDGTETPIYNVNYVLRGIEIPKGKHSIQFEFNPQVVQTGSQITLLSSVVFVLLVLGLIGHMTLKNKP